MSTKYRISARHSRAEIKPVECEKETEKSVWVPLWALHNDAPKRFERRQKFGDYEEYHDTWEDARDALMRYAADAERKAQSALDKAKRLKADIAALKKPK